MTLELNVFNMCKKPHHQEDDDNENEEINLIEPIIEEHIQDENFVLLVTMTNQTLKICDYVVGAWDKERKSTKAEQYVTLEIPSELIATWKREGYTHLHLGGIRLILTLHGRKGLPVTARLALLDTRFKEYQHVVIGTVLTTLHVRSELLTFYPNFNLSLQDLNLPTVLRVQIQLQGAEQIVSSKMAMLHHQLVYRLHNHALDLPTPHTSAEALMILADIESVPTIVQIPKQDLLKLMPLEWLSNYEKFHQNSQPIQTSEASYENRLDGTVRMTFKPPAEQAPRLSFSYSSMITVVSTSQEDIPISAFKIDGYPIYPAELNGHFLWDTSEAHTCDPGCPCLDDYDSDDDYLVRWRRKKKKKLVFANTPCHTYPPHMPDEPDCQRPLPVYNKGLKYLQKMQVQNTDKKIDNITAQLEQMYTNLKNIATQLDSELRKMIQQRYWGPEFDKKEAEIHTPPTSNPPPQAKDKHPTQPSQLYAAHSVPLLHLTSPSESSDSGSKIVNEFDSASDSEAEFADITRDGNGADMGWIYSTPDPS
ncbi:hypothetical protein KPL71_023829 [Citrus sinensis]|uniref:Uncharacterized protein n=1 Tax=Citrus sinensis TaxID=2711 RepID=A0ACB8ILI4_CITSI|nr:hypothetical protein KPL71_023829 [Citrus sinensis]